VAVYSSVTELIGSTPIVDVSQLSPNPAAKIYAKLESQNPAGSVKDRIAAAMIAAAGSVLHGAGMHSPLTITADPSLKLG